jgi:hypothetical protein
MVALIHDEPRECDRRLSQYFNSDREQWIEVVKAAVGARGACTDNNAKSAPGFYAWDSGITRMRQIFRKEGWEIGCEDGIEIIVNHDLKKKITVMNTDAGTADRLRSPRNRTIKGPAAEKVADLNDQIEMFKRREMSAPRSNENYATWYLCIFDNGAKVRAELSRPSKFSSGYFIKFSERIFILRGGDWEKIALATPAPPDSSQQFEINVRRK